MGLAVGTLIGAIGVGGIILSPLHVYFLGLNIHNILVSSSFGFLFAGIFGTIAYVRRQSISWRMVSWIGAGSLPAAVFGAMVNSATDVRYLLIILSIGVLVGFGSALTSALKSWQSGECKLQL